MEKTFGRRHPSTLPLWSLLALALLLLALFVLLSASGALLAPLLGQAAGTFDYLHEFAHDATPDRRPALGPSVVSAYLRRGMAAGLLAGLLAGLFAFLVGEPILDWAIALEEASAGAHPEEIFSRSTQKVGLLFATGLFGVTVGGVFGIVYAFFRERLAAGSDLKRSISLAGAIFAGAFLVPFLKYPANPPSVGDPSTIRERTLAYFTLVALSLLAILLAWLPQGR